MPNYSVFKNDKHNAVIDFHGIMRVQPMSRIIMDAANRGKSRG